MHMSKMEDFLSMPIVSGVMCLEYCQLKRLVQAASTYPTSFPELISKIWILES